MKIKEGFRMRRLGRDHIVVAEGRGLVNFNKMIVLNDTAAYLWDAVQGKDFDAASLSSLLCEKFEGVSAQQALSDSESLLSKWMEEGLVE